MKYAREYLVTFGKEDRSSQFKVSAPNMEAAVIVAKKFLPPDYRVLDIATMEEKAQRPHRIAV